PCLVYVMNRHDLKRFDRFNGVMFLIQFFIVEMFQETGSRAGHGNFGWGRRCAMYLLFVSAISMFYRNWRTMGKENKWYKITGVILLCLQLASGVFYFVQICMGYSYGI
ncbi:MAG: hypothetical protein LUG54_00760, partial [Clostridiales bacterium]|nr:hypothetical protein [Clostridiales bacterium]